MNKHLAQFLFENSPWNEFWSSWLVGFCIVDTDGQIYLTDSGEEYLDHLATESASLSSGQATAGVAWA